MATRQPAGTVTFLLTDIEGSTKLLSELGTELYARALDDHCRILRNAFENHGGYEVDYEGDAFVVAFQSANEALAAAGEAQRALAAHAWPDGRELRVRVGIYSGEPMLAPPKYVGLDVHRAARVMAAGHGGQVLVSASTAALVGFDALRDLGEHRFKDLSASERVYQLGGGDFPPLNSLHRSNLPVPSTPFVGRFRELGEIGALLADEQVRLITLTGPGGTGKTRLAAQAAALVSDEYPDGVFWIPLAAVRDPELVLESACQALGVRGGLASHIGERQLLLLFDNFEQVTDAARNLGDLLGASPNLKVLVTSREALHLYGEREYPVEPFAHDEAVEFFLARARSVRPDFENDGAVSQICRRLDELPLALELAAARTKVLSAEQTLERLEERLPLLTGGARDAPERQKTLKAAIDWSYDLLSHGEQRLFRRLSVFVGGCTLDAAEAVAEADLDTLQLLVEKSLLRCSQERYSMLETIREYAYARLLERGEAPMLRRRHAANFVELVHRAGKALEDSNDPAWLESLARELENLRSALAWMEETGDDNGQLEVIGVTRRFWQLRGYPREGLRALRGPLARTKGHEGRARALCMVGDVATLRQRYEEADGLLKEAERHAALSDSTAIQFNVPAELANLALQKGEYERAIGLFRKVLALPHAATDDGARGWAFCNLGYCFAFLQRWDEALSASREALVLSQRVPDIECIVWEFLLLAQLAVRRGNGQLAAVLVGKAEALRDECGLVLTGAEARVYRDTIGMLLDVLGDEELEAWRARGRAMSLDAATEHALRREAVLWA